MWVLGDFVVSFVFSLIDFENGCVARVVLLFAIRFGLRCCFGGFARWIGCCLELFTCSLLWLLFVCCSLIVLFIYMLWFVLLNYCGFCV